MYLKPHHRNTYFLRFLTEGVIKLLILDIPTKIAYYDNVLLSSYRRTAVLLCMLCMECIQEHLTFSLM